MRRSGFSLAIAVALLGLLCAPAVDAGSWKKLRDKAKKAVEGVVEEKVEEEVTEAARCAVGDERCVDEAKKNGREVIIVDENGDPVTGSGEAAPAGERPGEGVWRDYDFTPGRDVWRHVVFGDEPIGRFPAKQLEFVKGNMQIVELDGKRVLEISGSSVFRINLDEQLPDDFTLEFDLRTGAPNMATYVYFSPLETAHSRYDSYYLHLYSRPGVAFQGQPVSNIDGQRVLTEELTPIKLQVDGQYTILYVGTERAANIPNAKFPRTNIIEFHVGGNKSYRSYIGGVTVAVGVDELYDSLMSIGSFTTRGILFDVDSFRIRPESTPTLMQIERTLKEHAELKLRIEGHTDSTGSEEHNQELSGNRAGAVVDYLTDHGIEAGRLVSVGYGESRPVADNATPAGREQNRRVVIAVQE